MAKNKGKRRGTRHQGPVIRRDDQVEATTTDQRLLQSRGDTDWVHSDPWRVMRIQSEFIQGRLERLQDLIVTAARAP